MMNERIQALWKQAGGHYNSGNQHTWPEYTIDDPEKFAELIVRECAKVAKEVEGDEGDDYKSGRTWAGIDVLKHFGVKE